MGITCFLFNSERETVTRPMCVKGDNWDKNSDSMQANLRKRTSLVFCIYSILMVRIFMRIFDAHFHLHAAVLMFFEDGFHAINRTFRNVDNLIHIGSPLPSSLQCVLKTETLYQSMLWRSQEHISCILFIYFIHELGAFIIWSPYLIDSK